jgi:histidyl-tRNA synthetase
VKELVGDAPRMLDFLDPESAEHHRELLALLDEGGVPYRIEPRLVRGLDYYTRTVFEVTASGLGAQDALLGGGRYDRLVSDLGGPKTPGIGFAIGEDRLVDVLSSSFREAAARANSAVALVPLDPVDRAAALALARQLREAGIAVDLDPAGKGPAAGLKGAERRGLSIAVLVGGREREAGTAIVKNLASRSQESVPVGRLAEYLKGS